MNEKLGEPVVVFGTPLRAKSTPQNWDVIQGNLDHTIEAVFAQTTSHYHMVICGHDQPKLPDSKKISWLQADFPLPTDAAAGSADKARKHLRNIEFCFKKFPDGFYYMMLDADDLVSPRLASYILEDDNRAGYYVDKGYAFDAETGAFAPMDPSNKRPFYKSCGSCAAIWFAADAHDHYRDFFALMRVHGEIPAAFEKAEIPLTAIPFHAVIYILNHGANLSVEQGKSSVQTRHVSTHAQEKRLTLDDIRRIL